MILTLGTPQQVADPVCQKVKFKMPYIQENQQLYMRAQYRHFHKVSTLPPMHNPSQKVTGRCVPATLETPIFTICAETGSVS